MLAHLKHHLHHWFAPHHTNNFRARLLHNSGIFLVIGILLTGNVLIRLVADTGLHVLGFTSSVTIDEVVTEVNRERLASGLPALAVNDKLSDAARRKAADMFAENYWAHNSPSGKTPWYWFQQAGYSYTFAGENLAKDFGDTSRMVAAWMASPTHRDNILNSHYTETGIAVVSGSLLGADTVLVVQEFGTTAAGSVPTSTKAQATVSPNSNVKAAATPAPTSVPVQVAEVKEAPAATPVMSPVSQPQSRFNSFNISRYLAMGTTILFILALFFDLIIAESHSLSRRVGKNWAHIVFINVILLVVTIVNAGRIL